MKAPVIYIEHLSGRAVAVNDFRARVYADDTPFGSASYGEEVVFIETVFFDGINYICRRRSLRNNTHGDVGDHVILLRIFRALPYIYVFHVVFDEIARFLERRFSNFSLKEKKYP